MASQAEAAGRGLLPPLEGLRLRDTDERAEQAEQAELAFYEDTLRAAEGDEGLALRSLDVRPGCSVGDNFASIVTRNTARGVRGDGKPFERSMIVKRVPHVDEFRCLAAFAKESAAYRALVPALAAACARAGLALPLARCLQAQRPGLLVLEDLAARGFAMRPRQQRLDAAHALTVMEALGRFHGASLALARLDARAFRALRDASDATSELIFFPEAEAVFARSLQAAATLAALSLQRSGRPDLGQRLAARAEAGGRFGVFREMCAVVRPASGPAGRPRVPDVFTHGDCWANNLLFRYGRDGRPSEARLVDLAGIRCASPALDLLHFLSTSLPREARRARRGRELLRRYLDALGDTARRALAAAPPGQGPWRPGGEAPAFVNDVPSLELLEAEMRERAPFGLWVGLWMLPAIFFSPAIIPPGDYFSEEAQAAMCAAMPDEFHQRTLELVEEHVESGTL